MPNLFALLNWSATSLQAQTSQSATASHNLSNSSTPGYSRQTAEIEASLPAEALGGAFIGRGAQLGTVSQARDLFVERQLPGTLGAASRSQAEASALQALSALDPQGGAGLTDALAGFYSALQQLSQHPGDAGSRRAFVAASQTAALAFNRAGTQLADARSGIDTQLSADVQRVNNLSASLAALNHQVRIEQAAGAAPNDLLDARQRVQDELVGLTGAAVVRNSSGDVNLQLAGGGALVTGDTAATLSTQSDPANRGHFSLLLTASGTTSAQALTASSVGGELRGRLDARDGAQKAAEASIDTLAFDWASAVNTVHRAGFGLDGLSGRNLFTVSASASFAAQTLTVSAAVLADPNKVAASATAATIPGDATNLFGLIQTAQTALSTGASVFDTLASAIATFGGAAQSAQTASESDAAVRDQLLAVRASTSSVSIDDELVKLTQAQRGYEAVTKVITTTDQMLQSLFAIT